jgi:hypothetical protein
MQRNLSVTINTIQSSAKVAQELQSSQAKMQPIQMKSSTDYEQVSDEKMHGYTTRVSVVKKNVMINYGFVCLVVILPQKFMLQEFIGC